MGFMHSEDKRALKDHLLAIRERVDQVLRILNEPGESPVQDGDQPGERQSPGASKGRTTRGPPGGKGIPQGAWMDEPASIKQLTTLERGKVQFWDGITKGEASNLIDELYKRRGKR